MGFHTASAKSGLSAYCDMESMRRGSGPAQLCRPGSYPRPIENFVVQLNGVILECANVYVFLDRP